MPRLMPDPATSALLFSECQNGVIGPDSPLQGLNDVVAPMLPDMGRLAQGARDAGVLVCHLTYSPLVNNTSTNRRPPLFAAVIHNMQEWHSTHPAVQPAPEIGVGPDDLVLQRNTGLSPVYGTETFKLLRNVGKKSVVIAGVSTNVAIPTIAQQAADEDFDVFIVRDACAGSPPEYVEAQFKYSLPLMGHVRMIDDLLAHWGVAGG